MAVDKPESKERYKVLENVFSEPVLRRIFKLASQGLFDAVESPVSIGKEANIFTAVKGEDRVVLKIYRVENCNFNKISSYLKSDYRYSRVPSRKRQLVYSWAEREYRNLLRAREVLPVPVPLAYKENIVVMQFLGEKRASPQLKDVKLEHWDGVAEKCFSYIKKLKKINLVHGDLSEFNIIYHDDTPYLIDFSQSTPFDTPLGKELIERDFQSLLRFFSKRTDVDEVKARKWAGL